MKLLLIVLFALTLSLAVSLFVGAFIRAGKGPR